jgi:hypothetical protein
MEAMFSVDIVSLGLYHSESESLAELRWER